MKRVVVTGMAGITSIGQDWPTIEKNLRGKKSGIVAMTDWAKYEGLNTRLAGPIPDFVLPEHYNRKRTRSMGRVALLATRATELALTDAGLLDNPQISDGSMGVAYGSSSGTPRAIGDFGNMINGFSTQGITATTYIQMMNHTTTVNIGLFFGIRGRVITTSSACTSGSQGILYAYESIRYGRQTRMVAGGAEELCATHAAVFDTLFATSTKNDSPHLTPRPFDKDRDGLVIGEGAGALILEELETAKARGATIHAELVGVGTNCDALHVTQPTAETMATALKLALQDAHLPAEAMGYISAHGTATMRGDVAESHATYSVMGKQIPISSMKGYLGHTLGACGALEAIASIEMMKRGWFHPNLNLENVDPECAELDYIVGNGRELDVQYVMSNNFAFGGINTSLIFKRWN